MRKVWLHTYVRADGARVPYKVSDSDDGLSIIQHDDRVEQGWFITPHELEVIRRDAFEAARQTSLFWYVHRSFDTWVTQRRAKRCALDILEEK